MIYQPVISLQIGNSYEISTCNFSACRQFIRNINLSFLSRQAIHMKYQPVISILADNLHEISSSVFSSDRQFTFNIKQYLL